MNSPVDRWLLLIHQIPSKPDYLRVKIGRRIARLGAVAIKNGVYALPLGDEAQEDLQWVLREIVTGGGDGSVVAARFVDGLDDTAVETMFRVARDAECAPITEEARALLAGGDDERIRSELPRLHRRLDEVTRVDFFGSEGRAELERLVGSLDARLAPRPVASAEPDPGEWRGRTWVTRKGIQVDRMASAWLIKRFIDPDARFRWVDGRGFKPAPGELRFDMFEAEFTHEGDDCSFEVLRRRCKVEEPGLGPIAEIIHDIDVKDNKFARPEAAGVAFVLGAIAAANDTDDARMERASVLFDELLLQARRAG